MASPLPSRKRSPTSFAAEDNDNDDALLPPPPKKRAPRSTAAEKAQKKLARMERNRIAAQASRDRKKQHTEVLECRIAELEAQLASSAGTPPSSSSLLSPSATASPAFSASPFTPSVALPPLPSLPLAPAQPDATTVQLREENESLKTQLALEKLQSQALQIRLSALESKFGRLEQLLSGGGSLGSRMSQSEEKKQEEEEKPEETITTSDSTKVSSTMTVTDSSRLVAREVDQSLQRKLSHPSPSSTPLSTSSTRTRLPSTSLSTSPSLLPLLPPTASTSPSTSVPSLPPRPTLHEILSSIRVSPLPPTPLRPATSLRRGPTGRTSSTSLPSRRRLSRSSSLLSRWAKRSSTCSSSCAKTLLRAQRLRLFVRR